MGGPAGDNDKDTGPNPLAPGGKPMSQTEKDEFDKELSDFLGGEDTSSSSGRSGPGDMGADRSTGGYDTAGMGMGEQPGPSNNFAGSQVNNNTGWSVGDEAPPVPVVNGRTGEKFVNGKKVTEVEYEQAVADRSNFVDLASDPTVSKDAEDAFVAETMRSKGFSYNDQSDEARKAYDDSLKDLANYDQIQARNEAAARNLTSGSSPKSSQQLDLEMIASGALGDDVGLDQQLAAAEQLGMQLAKGNYSSGGFITDNINDMQLFGGVGSQQQVAEAIAKGFNNQTGTQGIDGLGQTVKNVTSGLGGHRMEIDQYGNVTLQTQGQNIGEFAGNTAIGVGSAYLGGVPGTLASGFNVKSSVPFSEYSNFMKGNTNPGVDVGYDPSGVVTSLVGSKVAPMVGMEVFKNTNNANLAQAAMVGSNMLTSKGVDALLGEDANTTLGNIGGAPAGQGSAPLGSMTNQVQSDLGVQPSSRVGPGDMGGKGIDLTDKANFNVKDGKSGNKKQGVLNVGNNNPGNNNGGDNGGNQALLNMSKKSGDVNTLADGNLGITNPMADDVNLPAGVKMLSSMESGFGNYLTKGKNRDYGNATFRTASRNEVNRSKRRSGIGNGILFG